MDALEKTVGYFSTVYPAHLAAEKINQSLYLTDVARVLSSGTDAASTYSSAILTMLHVSRAFMHYYVILFTFARCREVLDRFTCIPVWQKIYEN